MNVESHDRAKVEAIGVWDIAVYTSTALSMMVVTGGGWGTAAIIWMVVVAVRFVSGLFRLWCEKRGNR